MKRLLNVILLLGLLLIIYLDFRMEAAQKQRHLEQAKTTQPMLVVVVPKGERRQFVLPDSTMVWLNAASTLSYPPNMGEETRTVELTGEAFFAVKRELQQPFRVKSRDIQIEVLGTRFSLRDYPEEAICRTRVAEGAIRLKHNDTSAVLETGEEAQLDLATFSGSVLTVRSGIDTAETAPWTKGLIQFDHADLATMLRELSRAFNVEMRFEGRLPDVRFSGSFPLDQSLEDIIQGLDFHNMHVRMRRAGANIVIVSAIPA